MQKSMNKNPSGFCVAAHIYFYRSFSKKPSGILGVLSVINARMEVAGLKSTWGYAGNMVF